MPHEITIKYFSGKIYFEVIYLFQHSPAQFRWELGPAHSHQWPEWGWALGYETTPLLQRFIVQMRIFNAFKPILIPQVNLICRNYWLHFFLNLRLKSSHILHTTCLGLKEKRLWIKINDAIESKQTFGLLTNLKAFLSVYGLIIK